MNLPTAAQDEVLELLGLEVVEEHFEYEPPKKLFGITILSPLKAEIVGPNGEVLSQDQNTFGEEMAEYDDDPNDPDDPIDITIVDPPEGTYAITYTGTGEGEYTVITTYADEDETVSSVKDGVTHLGETTIETINITSDTTSLIDDEDYQALLHEIIELAKQAKDDNGIAGHELANIVQRVVRAQADLKLYERAMTKDHGRLSDFWLTRYYHNLDDLVQQAEQITAGPPQQPPRRIFGRFRDRDNDNIDKQVRAEFASQITQILDKIQRYSPPR